MKEAIKQISLILVAVAIAIVCSVFIIRWGTIAPVSNQQPYLIKTLIQYDSIRPNIIIPPASTPDIVIPPKHETINYYIKADSALLRTIIEEYFKTRIYSDTLRDSSIEAIINMSISQNIRDEFNFKYRKLSPSVTNLYQAPKPESKIKIMGGAQFRFENGSIEPGLNLSVLNKKGHLFGIQKEAGKFKLNEGWGGHYMIIF